MQQKIFNDVFACANNFLNILLPIKNSLESE